MYEVARFQEEDISWTNREGRPPQRADEYV